ncbi:acetyltransferase [Enterococcus sp. JM4C]|uniref:GNAT family N-acetyltransferase n=1 Tax=Candidatus Enterococcus huntleyi TaxID=1857217 RepID=UPI00137A261B|nr:N-acetyltransferase [Enterococcus sp. JM4C]KAF1299471.1 acetyltransferase [Enterococcus sp. JM4C]
MNFQLETSQDYFAVETLTREAFWNVYQPGCSEHLILHQLRKSPAFIEELSYLAREDSQIIAHIAYTKLYRDDKLSEDVIAFGPLSVHPAHQKKGIGRKLIQLTIEEARRLGFKAILITGSPDYYQASGFKPAKSFGLTLAGLPLDEEAPYFLAYEIIPGYCSSHLGTYSFAPEFSVTAADLEAFEQHFPKKEKRAPKETDV